MPVVQGVALSVGGTAIADARVDIRLVASLTEEAAGYVGSTDREILDRVHIATDVTGAWSATLTANTLITPSNTYYEVVVTPPGGKGVVHQIVVPNGAGPYWVGDILYNGAGTLPTWPLDDHLADLVDAHDASAISVTAVTGLAATTVQAAVAELAASKVGDCVILTDYTGVPDGTADNAAGFRLAIAAAAAAGVPLVIPDHGVNWRVGSTVNVNDLKNLTVIGLSARSTTTEQVQGGQVAIQGLAGLGTDPMFSFTTSGGGNVDLNLHLEGVQFTGAEIPVLVDQAAMFTAERCTFRASANTGVNAAGLVIRDTFWFKLRGCAFRSSTNTAFAPVVRLQGTQTAAAADGYVWEGLFQSCTFRNGGVVYEQKAASSGGYGGLMVFFDCQTETLGEMGMLRIDNQSATHCDVQGLTFVNCTHWDQLPAGRYFGSYAPIVEMTSQVGFGGITVHGATMIGGNGMDGPFVGNLDPSNNNGLKAAVVLGNRNMMASRRLHLASDAAITSGAATVTSAAGGFTSNLTGHTVVIDGAGAAGADLTGTFTYVNATTGTVSVNASTTVAAAKLLILGPAMAGGVRQKNAGFDFWDNGSTQGAGSSLMSSANVGGVGRVAVTGERYARLQWSSDGITAGDGTGDYDAPLVRVAAKTWGFGRHRATGTAHVAGDYALSAGWGTGATVSLVQATDKGGNFQVNAGAASFSANPTITLTFKDGTWGANTPSAVLCRRDGNQLTVPLTYAVSATQLIVTFNGTPVAGETYRIAFSVDGR